MRRLFGPFSYKLTMRGRLLKNTKNPCLDMYQAHVRMKGKIIETEAKYQCLRELHHAGSHTNGEVWWD